MNKALSRLIVGVASRHTRVLAAFALFFVLVMPLAGTWPDQSASAQGTWDFWMESDMDLYGNDQTIRLFGNIGYAIADHPVAIQVFDERNNRVDLDQVQTDSSGDFEATVGPIPDDGSYIVQAEHEFAGSAWTTFAIGQLQLPGEGLGKEPDGIVEAVDRDGLSNEAALAENDAVDVYGNEGSGIAPPLVNAPDDPPQNLLYDVTYNVLSMALSYPLHTTGDSTYDQATANAAAALYFGSSFAAIAEVLVLLSSLSYWEMGLLLILSGPIFVFSVWLIAKVTGHWQPVKSARQDSNRRRKQGKRSSNKRQKQSRQDSNMHQQHVPNTSVGSLFESDCDCFYCECTEERQCNKAGCMCCLNTCGSSYYYADILGSDP